MYHTATLKIYFYLCISMCVCVCHIECATKHTNRYIYSRCRMYAYIHNPHTYKHTLVDRSGAGCVNSARYNNNNKQSNIRTHPLGKMVTYIFLYIYHILHIYERYTCIQIQAHELLLSHHHIYMYKFYASHTYMCLYAGAI